MAEKPGNNAKIITEKPPQKRWNARKIRVALLQTQEILMTCKGGLTAKELHQELRNKGHEKLSIETVKRQFIKILIDHAPPGHQVVIKTKRHTTNKQIVNTYTIKRI